MCVKVGVGGRSRRAVSSDTLKVPQTLTQAGILFQAFSYKWAPTNVQCTYLVVTEDWIHQWVTMGIHLNTGQLHRVIKGRGGDECLEAQHLGK